MAELERIYTVPLSGAYNSNRRRRAKRAMKILKEFLARHMKTAPEKVWISPALNDHVLSHGMQAPPRRVRLKVSMGSDAIARASLLDEKPAKAEKKPAEKAEKKPAEKAEKKPAEKKPEPAGTPKGKKPDKEEGAK